MSTWEEVQLKDIVSILGDGLHGTPEYSEDGEYYFVNGNNLNEGSITINQETQKVPYSEYLKYKKELSDRTLLVSINGTLGNVAYYQGEKVLLGKSACYFNLLDDVDKGFIRYILSTPYFQKYIQTYANGTTIKNLSLKAMREFSFNLPPLQEQKQVANILSCLDRKISNLRQQNETLERIAQTLFKHWFVDFEFPNEDGKPYKSSGGEMVRSELGEIPAGWYVKKIENVIDVRDGTHESPKQTKEGFHLITSKHLKKEGIDFESAYLISESDYIEANKRSKVDNFDILVSMIGTVGLLYFVMEKEINFVIKNIGLFKTSKNQNYAEFVFLFLTSVYGKLYFRTRLGGTTQSFISLASLREMNLLIPNELLLLEFRKVAKSIFNKSYANSNQIQVLTKTRDVLLPKLMSGKLRITTS